MSSRMRTRGLLNRLFLFLLSVLILAPTLHGHSLEDDSITGEVVLPLDDYLALRDAIGSRVNTDDPVDAVAEVSTRRSVFRVERERVIVSSVFEVQVRGYDLQPVTLSTVGIPSQIVVEPPDGASVSRRDGQLVVLASRPGTFRIEATQVLPIDSASGRVTISISPGEARVSKTELDLPAEFDWSCPGAVLVDERIEAERKHLELALRPEINYDLALHKRLSSSETLQTTTHANTTILTLLELGIDRWRRRDLVLYEVARGSLSTLEIESPPFPIDRFATDEGPVLPAAPDASTGSIRVERDHLLERFGFLELTSYPDRSKRIELAPVRAGTPARAHYVVVMSAVAAQIDPVEREDWLRSDIDDLPALYRQAWGELQPTAVWRAAGPDGSNAFEVDLLAARPTLDTIVERRVSTTLITAEGSLVQRDDLSVTSSGSAFQITLSENAVLWSASVDGQLVRPVEKDGSLFVPLLLGARGRIEHSIEVTSVTPQTIPEKRSSMSLELPRVQVPVIDQRWRVILPSGASYRYEGGTLDQVEEVVYNEVPVGLVTGLGGSGIVRGSVTDASGAELPGATVRLSGSAIGERTLITDRKGAYWFNHVPRGRYVVTADLDGFTSESSSIRLRPNTLAETRLVLRVSMSEAITVTSESPAVSEFEIDDSQIERLIAQNEAAAFQRATQDLQQGTVGGVRPLPVDLPETGKVLQLAGALPLERVLAEISVRPNR